MITTSINRIKSAFLRSFIIVVIYTNVINYELSL
jgi:hypothetical protein